MQLSDRFASRLAGAVACSAMLLATSAAAADAITLRQGTSTARPTASSPAMTSGTSNIYGNVRAYLYQGSNVACSAPGSMLMKVGTNPAPSIQLTLQSLSGCGLTLRAPVVGTLTTSSPTINRGPLNFPGIEFVAGPAGSECIVTPTFDPPASGALNGRLWNNSYSNSPLVPTYATDTVRLRSTTNTSCASKWASLALAIEASPLRSVGGPRGGTTLDGPLVGVFG